MLYVSLPSLAIEIQEHAKRLRSEIDQLPQKPSTDPQQELLTMVMGFASEVRNLVQGSEGQESFIQGLNIDYAIFRDNICSTLPIYLPFARGDVFNAKDQQEPEFLLETYCEQAEEGISLRPKILLDEIRKNINQGKTRELPRCKPQTMRRGNDMLNMLCSRSCACQDCYDRCSDFDLANLDTRLPRKCSAQSS